MVRHGRTRGYSLVELLIVVSILAILLGLLLPAVQAAREAARRVQCANNLHHMGLALLSYDQSLRRLPAGIAFPSCSFWTASILPHLEQATIYQELDFSQGWQSDMDANGLACTTYLSVFRCPSSQAPLRSSVQGVPNRVPSNYLAVGSGTSLYESGSGARHLGLPKQDGLLFVNSWKSMSQINDGTSQTLALGEAVFDVSISGADLDRELIQIVDHWYIGSDGVEWRVDGAREVSEAIGSTGVPINSVFQDIWIDAKEICFSSLHHGGSLFVFADGHVQFLSQAIDSKIYSAAGTIAENELTTTVD